MTPETGSSSKEEIRARTREAVTSFCCEPRQRRAVLDLLSRPGYALDPGGECFAGRVALEVYSSLIGRTDDVGIDAAVAVELHMEAACFFDDVADAPPEEGDVSSRGKLLSLAIAVLACGNAWASRVAPSTGTLVEFHRYCLIASSGQFLDALLQREDAVDPEEALEMTRRKSGALGRSAAGFGARLATQDPKMIGDFEKLGGDLFTFAQLVDDLRDASPRSHRPMDFEQRRKTVPLNYLYRYLRDSSGGRIASLQEFRREYETSGAPLYGAVVAEAFLNRAKAKHRQLAEKGLSMEPLDGIIRQLEGGLIDAVGAIELVRQEPI